MDSQKLISEEQPHIQRKLIHNKNSQTVIQSVHPHVLTCLYESYH